MARSKLLYYCEAMESTAKKINELDPTVELGTITWKRFAGGMPHPMIKEVDAIRRSEVTFLMHLYPVETIVEQLAAMRHIAALVPGKYRLIMPFYSTGTQEWADHEGQVIMADEMAEQISVMPPVGPGPVSLYTWDVHNLAIKSFFKKNVRMRPKSALGLLRDRISSWCETIVFPDMGAFKRFKNLIVKRYPRNPDDKVNGGWNFVVCGKDRGSFGTDRRVVIIDGDIKGRYGCIVDDLRRSGGTLDRAKEACYRAGATGMSGFVSHMCSEGEDLERLVDSDFDHFFFTDSCPDTAALIDGRGPCEVLSIISTLLELINHYDTAPV